MFDTSSEVYIYGILPFLIFLARVADVSIGTLRIIFISRGRRYFAPIMGFFEILIWVLAVTNIMQNLNNWVCYIAYAGGFAMGNYVGLIIEEKLAVGDIIFRIIVTSDHRELMTRLNAAGFGTTAMKAEGSKAKVHVVYSIVRRNNADKVMALIRETTPDAFFTMEDIKMAKSGKIPVPGAQKSTKRLFRRWRKGK
ncbi:MAG: DUF2179 domain-containing protein [Bacteroidetes bacterium]|jgi:uncharacterized protein YebE (UPF0316 family)|nr:DUF2179 domain-containing protein [Bacteroidota bacterium]